MDTRTQKQRMLDGDLYNASGDAELASDNARASAWMDRYNETVSMPPEERRNLLVESFAYVGVNVNIRPPIYIDYGYNISIGDGVFLNYNCIVLDVVKVTIGEGTQIGPGVQILTADHPRDPEVRAQGLELGRPITIGRNVWIGGGAIILPGVTIGDNALVGAGAVVTRDVPAAATALGNPAKIRPVKVVGARSINCA